MQVRHARRFNGITNQRTCTLEIDARIQGYLNNSLGYGKIIDKERFADQRVAVGDIP
jgi:hypothetical protein